MLLPPTTVVGGNSALLTDALSGASLAGHPGSNLAGLHVEHVRVAAVRPIAAGGIDE